MLTSRRTAVVWQNLAVHRQNNAVILFQENRENRLPLAGGVRLAYASAVIQKMKEPTQQGCDGSRELLTGSDVNEIRLRNEPALL